MSVRQLPRTYPEVLTQSQLVGSQRTGRGSANFTLAELKQIARNLGLETTGTKDVLANRIMTTARAYAPTRQLPQTYPELLDELPWIGGQRTARGAADFTLTELKQIARNLGLTQTGTKQEISNRLLNALRDYLLGAV